MKKIAALIVAGGEGSRFGGLIPKQYCLFQGKTVIYQAVQPFVTHSLITNTQVVIGKETDALYKKEKQIQVA